MSETPRTDEHLRMKEENGHVAVVSREFARQLETELADARAEIEKFNNLFKNGIDCFASPCEKHSGENTPPFDEFIKKYGYKCTPCLVEELADALAKLRKLEAKKELNFKEKNMKTPRTDQAAFEANFGGTVLKVVGANFARQLEIELATAKAKLRKLRKKINEKKENEKLPIIG